MKAPPPTPPHRAGLRFLAIAGVIAGIVILGASFSSRALTDIEWARLASGAVVLLLIAARLATSRQPLAGIAGQAALLLGFGERQARAVPGRHRSERHRAVAARRKAHRAQPG